MPTYEYTCGKCNKRFAVTMSISDHDRQRVTCPKCKSTDVKRRISSFVAMTSKKS